MLCDVRVCFCFLFLSCIFFREAVKKWQRVGRSKVTLSQIQIPIDAVDIFHFQSGKRYALRSELRRKRWAKGQPRTGQERGGRGGREEKDGKPRPSFHLLSQSSVFAAHSPHSTALTLCLPPSFPPVFAFVVAFVALLHMLAWFISCLVYRLSRQNMDSPPTPFHRMVHVYICVYDMVSTAVLFVVVGWMAFCSCCWCWCYCSSCCCLLLLRPPKAKVSKRFSNHITPMPFEFPHWKQHLPLHPSSFFLLPSPHQ